MDELNANARKKQNEELDAEEELARERARLNSDFYMLFKKTGSPVLRDLIGLNPTAARIFMLLAETADRTNAIVASGKALAAALGTSEASVSRSVKLLIERKLIDKFKTGNSNVFILNPEVVWSAWKTGKDYCLFGNAKVLLSKNEQDTMTQKRMNVMFAKKPQIKLQSDEDGVITNMEELEAAGQQRLDV